MRTQRIALCQINTVVGDLQGNVNAIVEAYETARAQGAQIAVFPELAVPGYPAEDLLIRQGFLEEQRLPNYGPFDEARHFDIGSPDQPLFSIGGVRVGLSICEDIWYPDGPPVQQALRGAEFVINVNASPFHEGKLAVREAMLRERVRAAGCPLVYLNLVGGQDELIFDGASMVFDASGALVARSPQFRSDVQIVEVEIPDRLIPVTLPVIDVP